MAEVISRRRFFQAASFLAWPILTGCGAHHAVSLTPPCPGPLSDFPEVPGFGDRTVLRILPKTNAETARALVLLHELPGLTPDDLALARCLAGQGFAVYLPLLFGKPGQDSFFRGFLKACWWGDFKCSTRSARSEVLDWLGPVCDRALELSNGQPIGVIGMCLTGILPLALLRDRITAAVVCQPTLPFSTFRRRPVGAQKSDLGMSPGDLQKAIDAKVPFLAVRYGADPLCPTERFDAVRNAFKDHVATIELPGDGHSVLASSYNDDAFTDAVSYLKVRLNVEPGPKRMKLAVIGQRPCEITSTGTWRAL